MKWDSVLYDQSHAFVAEYGKSLTAFVNTQRGQKILDLGCGTGVLTARLAQNGAEVLGADSSEEMIHRARERFPGLSFAVLNALSLPFENEFDTVFSNAVFHWIEDQPSLLTSVHRALKPGGLLVCELGAKGNIAAVEAAFSAALSGLGGSYRSPFFFPSAREYAPLLEKAGFTVLQMDEYNRPTPLQGGESGLCDWMRQFFAGTLALLSGPEAEKVLAEAENRCRPALYHDGRWTADYRRLRVTARKSRP